MIYKLSYNCVVSPSEEKFRRVRLANPKIKALLVDCPGALASMHELGWEATQVDGEQMLILPPNKSIPMADCRKVMDRQETVEKELKRSGSSASLASSN